MRAVTVALLFAACAPIERAALPGLPDGRAVGTIVRLSYEASDRPEGVRGRIDRGPVLLGASVEDAELLLLYPETPAELGWPVGPVKHLPGALGRLRAPPVVYAWSDGWAERAEAASWAALRQLRFNVLEGEPCSDGAGCLDGEPSDGVGLYCGPSCGELVVAPPMEPAAPAFGACAEGFSRGLVGSSTVCETPPLAASCGAGARATLEGGCASVGPACPAGAFAEPPPGASVLFVDASAGASGDGSSANPYRLRDALERAAAEDVLLLSAGAHYAPTLAIDRPLTLLGACARTSSVVVTRELTSSSTLTLSGLNLELRQGGVSLEAGRLALEGATMLFSGSATIAHGARWSLEDARLTARRTSEAAGLRVRARGVLSAVRSELVELDAIAHGRIEVHESVLRGLKPVFEVPAGGHVEVDGSAAMVSAPLVIATGGEAALSRVQLDCQPTCVVADARASVTLSSALLRGVDLEPRYTVTAYGGARLTLRDVVATEGVRVERAELELERVAFVGAHRVGLDLSVARARVRDLHTEDCRFGLGAFGDGELSVERARFLRSGMNGFQLELCENGLCPLTPYREVGARFADVRVSGSGEHGVRLDTSFSTTEVRVTLERVRVEGAHGSGLLLKDKRLLVSASDLAIAGVEALVPQSFLCLRYFMFAEACRGVGLLAVLEAGELELTRFSIEGYGPEAVYLADDMVFVARDGRIGEGEIGVRSKLAEPVRERLVRVRSEARVPLSELE